MGTVEFPSSIHVRRRSGRVRAVYIMKILIQNDGGDEEMDGLCIDGWTEGWMGWVSGLQSVGGLPGFPP